MHRGDSSRSNGLRILTQPEARSLQLSGQKQQQLRLRQPAYSYDLVLFSGAAADVVRRPTDYRGCCPGTVIAAATAARARRRCAKPFEFLFNHLAQATLSEPRRWHAARTISPRAHARNLALTQHRDTLGDLT